MKNVTVLFRDTDNVQVKGTIVDKVNVLPVGGSAHYTNYVIVDEQNKFHVVNPFNLLVIYGTAIKSRASFHNQKTLNSKT